MFLSRLAAGFLFLSPIAAYAHEFWIEPISYQIETGAALQADFKNGEEFKGSSLSFFDRSSARFDLVVAGKVQALSPRSGDSPALDLPAPVPDGLVVIVHETTPSRLTYKEWEKFLKFAAHKDFPTAAADHKAAGWSQERFKERYTRHVKALVAVGSGEGADMAVGLETEFVALSNPYDASFDNMMKVALAYQGQPRPDAQVEVFARGPDGTVTISLHRTDSQGIAEIGVEPGHDYLFDAVVLRPAAEASTQEDALVWETLWAALTFSVPQ